MICPSQISIIVQGYISEQYTTTCLKSLRQHLPEAEIILSTTGKTIPQINGYDVLVLSEDPGAQLIDIPNNVYNNINRQIASTRAGLEKATRPYSLKFRSDLILDGIEWLSYFQKYDLIAPATCFKNRVLICDFYTRNPRIMPVSFHPSDWIMFGRTEDLKVYYATELQAENEILWFNHNLKRNAIFGHMLSRYTPEQYLCYQYLKRFKKIQFQNYYDNTATNIQETERFFAENMVILDYHKQLQITFEKYNPNRYNEAFSLIHHKDWKILFDHYCCKSNRIRWSLYVCKCTFYRLFLMKARRWITLILSKVGLKEPLKKLLRSIS